MAEFQEKLISHVGKFLLKIVEFVMLVGKSFFLLSVKLLELVILALKILSEQLQ